LKYTDPTGMTETIYYFFNSNLSAQQKAWINNHLNVILGAIAKRLNAISGLPWHGRGHLFDPDQVASADYFNPSVQADIGIHRHQVHLAALSCSSFARPNWGSNPGGDFRKCQIGAAFCSAIMHKRCC
jgi:hypothetical protein